MKRDPRKSAKQRTSKSESSESPGILRKTQLEYRKELQALTARLLAVQEAGNRELARELHDVFSQKLAALGMEVSTLLQTSAESRQSLPERLRGLSARIHNLAEPPSTPGLRRSGSYFRGETTVLPCALKTQGTASIQKKSGEGVVLA